MVAATVWLLAHQSKFNPVADELCGSPSQSLHVIAVTGADRLHLSVVGEGGRVVTDRRLFQFLHLSRICLSMYALAIAS